MLEALPISYSETDRQLRCQLLANLEHARIRYEREVEPLLKALAEIEAKYPPSFRCNTQRWKMLGMDDSVVVPDRVNEER